MLFLGFSAGLPLLLVFSSLSLWLSEAGVERAVMTQFSWAALAYSFKFVWAPLLDRLPLPVLHEQLGRRRSWLLVAQLAVIVAIVAMALTDPARSLVSMAVAAAALGFAAASQDVVIDAWRIESAEPERQASLAAMYVTGYRVGMIASGAGALYLAQALGSTAEQYDYAAWRNTYLFMAGLMLVGVATTLAVQEPKRTCHLPDVVHGPLDYVRFLLLFIVVSTVFVLAVTRLPVGAAVESGVAGIGGNGTLAGFAGQAVQLLLALTVALASGWFMVAVDVVNREMVRETYIDPVRDFFSRYGRAALAVLLLVGFYRSSDIMLGVIANVFYHDMGFDKAQIAFYNKVFGLLMILVGGFAGGILAVRMGVMRLLLLGAVLAACTNLLFLFLTRHAGEVPVLALVIAAGNLSAGLATAAFIAYLSALTNISFTAMQYAIFSSLMTLFPKLLGGYSGRMVDELGYDGFFVLTALLGVPVILMVLWVMRRHPVETAEPPRNDGAPR